MNIFISLNFPGMARKEYYCDAVMTLGKEVNGFSSSPDWFLHTMRFNAAYEYGEIDYHL